MTSRRAFFGGSAAAAAGLISSPGIASDNPDNLPPNIPEWMKVEGAPLQGQPYTLPSKFESRVARLGRGDEVMPGSGSVQSPLHLLRGMITPAGLTFERSHAGIPEIDPAQHRLMIHGLVKHPLILTMDDIVRFPSVSRIYFLECSGNGSREWEQPFGKTAQITHGLVSCCEWTGVLLSTVLAEVGVEKDASWVLAEGADACAMTRSVPLAKCYDDAMLVYGQNGEMLRPQQGYPLRLFLPGFEGNMSIKWLRRLKVGSAPFMTREETSKYTDSMPDGTARQFTFGMDAKSVITYPSPGHQLKQPGFYEISGIAWSGHGSVRRVDISVDGGRSWRPAELQAPILDLAVTRFRLPWTWNGGEAVLQSRVVDSTGYVQPARAQLIEARGYASQYHYNAIQSWKLSAKGELSNVHA